MLQEIEATCTDLAAQNWKQDCVKGCVVQRDQDMGKLLTLIIEADKRGFD